MEYSFLEIGMKVSIEIRRKEAKHFFSSKIEEIKSDLIFLGMPMKAGRTFFVGINEKVYIYFPRKGSFYCLEGVVEEKQYHPIPIIVAKPLRPPYKKQKRSFFRLKIILNIQIRTSDCEKWIEGYTRDISGGGAKICIPQKIKKGTIVEILIPEILGKEILKAVVVRTGIDTINSTKTNDMAIQFIEINENIRDKIIKFILAKQRILREKGLE